MDEESVAVSMDFVPFAVRSMWAEAGLTRAEKELEIDHPSKYREIVEHAEDYGVAVEYRTRGTDIGQYGYDTAYRLEPVVDDHVVENAAPHVERDLAKLLAETWTENIVEVVSEAQEATTLSTREFATLILSNNETVSEKQGADALGIAVGTYRGKKGRIKEKQRECEESSILHRITQHHGKGTGRRGRSLGDLASRNVEIAPSEIYDYQVSNNYPTSWKLPRESPRERQHETYEEAHWRTTHVEGVDRVFSTDVSESNHDEIVRLDLDGIGADGADMHRKGENIQTSIWIGQPQATMLFRQLAEALQDSATFEKDVISDEAELSEWVDKHALPGDKIQIIDSDTLDIDPVAQATVDW